MQGVLVLVRLAGDWPHGKTSALKMMQVRCCSDTGQQCSLIHRHCCKALCSVDMEEEGTLHMEAG